MEDDEQDLSERFSEFDETKETTFRSVVSSVFRSVRSESTDGDSDKYLASGVLARGLQGSTLTTRAVSHDHVTKKSFMKWLRMEMGASLCLGLSMGAVLGFVAYQASGYDFVFGLTIYFAQFISIVTAGLTGTLAPL
eukprot:1313413-Ditylum_brightwellii.AAC.1